VGPSAVLGAVVKRKIPSPSRKSNPRTSIVQPVGLHAFILCLSLIWSVPTVEKCGEIYDGRYVNMLQFQNFSSLFFSERL
jgi:hypothetical protein